MLFLWIVVAVVMFRPVGYFDAGPGDLDAPEVDFTASVPHGGE